MFFSLALALVALTAPEGDPIPDVELTSLQATALALEILDPRERDYFFADRKCLEFDLRTIRRRYADLRDAPPACDSSRFPSRSLVNELLQANRNYRQWLVDRRLIDKGVWIDAAIQDTEDLYAAWDLVRDASSDFYYITVRRAAMQSLRSKIGPHLYYAGCMPPHVPTWWLFPSD